MLSHIARSETHGLFGKRYQLSAQMHVTPDELHIINHSRLDRIEIFHDPLREQYDDAAAAYHAKAKARGLFVTRARDTAVIVGAETRAVFAAIRALRAFRVTVGDMLRPGGVTLEHKSLQAITELERAITECVDTVDRFLRAARGYHDTTEDIFAPGTDKDATVPPAEWPRTWQR